MPESSRVEVTAICRISRIIAVWYGVCRRVDDVVGEVISKVSVGGACRNHPKRRLRSHPRLYHVC